MTYPLIALDQAIGSTGQQPAERPPRRGNAVRRIPKPAIRT
ncbi:hypothetical protein OHA40_15530 [Nocardia sp. NBC_00508]|nr:hypothetical protein [Nocardia sp. NBC_00508]WUD69409.1 hypothetical protein OHA40_15530 [Nocardia sp. NBC_00508]